MEALLLKFVEGISSQLGASSVSFLQFMCCFCFGDEKTKLESRLSTVKARLLDAEEQQDHTHTKEDLIERLQPILYEAEDLLEEIKFYDETADLERRNILCRFFKTTIPFHIRMPLELKAISGRLDEFKAEIAELPQQQQRSRDGGHPNTMEPQSFRRSADIKGREKDKEAIKNMLQESSMSSDGSNVPIIIAIFGMGGLGKTTLARSVYEDAEGFDLKIMVWVSQNFDLKRLLIEVIKAATGKEYEQTGMIQLDSKLRECLDGKKYLLVLDDIWNTDYVKWDDFGNLLKGGAKGSVILATTRERNVASTMGADPIYELKGLDEDDCWSLFEQQLRFKIDQMEEKHMFVAIGKKILNKCGGNPLAIKTVGGLLQYSDRKEWLNIENDRLWSPAQVGNILPALKVSYARLPYHLKKCFAYCSLFPRGDGIMKTELTQLWFAQGFVYQHSNNGLLADSADECFNELRNRSFLQDEENDEYGDVTCCKLHDLMYDLAQKVARSECVIVNQDSVPNISERIIHVSFKVKVFFNEDTTVADRLNKAGIVPTKVRNLRTLLRSGICSDLKADFYTTFKRLRVLELKCICEDNPNVLNSVRKLIHLRYLDLSGSKMRTLPNSICKLRYLQTLKLNCCFKLEELSGDIKKLTSLIHLENGGCVSLKGMPLGIGQLTSIQTLSVFVLGGEGWAGLSELEGLNNLRGDLWIQNLHNARNAISESRKAFYLKDKKHLQELRLDWPIFLGRAGGSDKDDALLESLQPNPHLKGLDISGYGGVKFPSWMDKLRYLQTLKLKFCSELEELLGDIKKLTSLIHLEIIGCDRLKGMPLGIGQLTSIQTLSVFVLGGKGWAGLSELEGLNNLRGSLRIKNLHNARNAISESRKAFYLKDKEHLQTLRLWWGMREVEDRDKDVALLESLQPNPHLKELTIDGYGGVKFPSWMGKSLPNLVEIRLVDCPSCECLPLFGDQLRSLKRLWLTNLSKLEYIRSYVSDSSFPPSSSSSPFNSNILSGAAGFFPALKNVSLNSLPKLKEWSIEVIVGDDGGKPKTDSAAATQPKRLLSLNTLSTLEIYDCPELTSMPSFPNIAVRRLDGFNGALLQSMTMAETICPTASSLPSFLTLSKLNSLTIANSNDLVSLPQGWLENFTSLDILRITDCAQLESLSRETPQMPKDLKGKALDFPEEDDLQSCRKLRSLKLKNQLSSLPKGLQHATKLEIEECPGLDLPKGL